MQGPVTLLPGRADALKLLLLAGVYVVAARIGLLFDPVGGFATLVWPPSGIALVALILHGPALWPGVLLGAAAANALAGAPVVTALVIGAGNSGGALAGALLLLRLGFDRELHDTHSALRLAAVALVSAAIPASMGTTALLTGGLISSDLTFEVWRAWWTGDAIGNLLVAPLVLVWTTRKPHAVTAPRRVEFAGVLLVTAVMAAPLFTLQWGPARPASYLIYPPLVWAAVRFGVRGAVTAVALAATIAISGTVMERGPFVRDDLSSSLLGLQMFVGITTATFLVLGATVAERRAAEARAMRERAVAEEANRAKAEFLAVMSHELRTPLNAIGGFLDLMLMGVHGALTETQRQTLQRIQRNHYHLLALINDLLAFTKLEAGKIRLAIAPTRVVEAIDHVEPLIQPDLARKRMSFHRRCFDERLTVQADPDKLAQILLNLVSNAVKYSHEGSAVEVGAQPDNGVVRLWVRDTGIGIPSDKLDTVFEPFFQVDRGHARRYTGVGLGLTIARDLARAMGGDVTIESRLGEGTCVSLRLPSAQGSNNSC